MKYILIFIFFLHVSFYSNIILADTLKIELRELTKKFNTEIHSQQYKNDSLFNETSSLHKDIIIINKDLRRNDRNIHFLRETYLENKTTTRTYNIIFVTLISLIYIILFILFIRSRKVFIKKIKVLKELYKKDASLLEKKIAENKKDLLEYLKDSIKELNKVNEENKQELVSKINEQRASIENKILQINNQLDDKFK